MIYSLIFQLLMLAIIGVGLFIGYEIYRRKQRKAAFDRWFNYHSNKLNILKNTLNKGVKNEM